MTILTGTPGNDSLVGGVADDSISGLDGNDTLKGAGGDDTLSGDAGNDSLDGGNGIDSLAGGSGNDYYIVTPDDVVTENASEGIDTLQSATSWTLGANLERLVLTGNTLTTLAGTGNALNNLLTGEHAGGSLLSGLEGNDTLIGHGFYNSDTLDGGDGNDTLDGRASSSASLAGGAGNDVYFVDRDCVVVELVAQGTDTVRSKDAWTLGANLENLVLLSSGFDTNGTGNELNNSITGNAKNNLLTGLGGSDHLFGNRGADTLVGGAGADTLAGGTGADLYIVTVGDVVVEKDSYTDTIRSTTSWTLPDHVERLELSGTATINGVGNALGNEIVGNAAANILLGRAGPDILTGGAGADTLVGALGSDELTGGAGADVFQLVADPSSGVDSIDDFQKGTDKIALDVNVFPGLGPGGSAVLQYQKIFSYGFLYYDPDGDGPMPHVEILDFYSAVPAPIDSSDLIFFG